MLYKMLEKFLQTKFIKQSLVIVLFTIGTIFLVAFSSKTVAKNQCNSRGGELVWSRSSRMCVEKYIDGGKECASSFDCEGQCYVHNEGETPTCELDNNPNKCRGTLNAPPIRCTEQQYKE